jgi:4-hydroxy-L-threonine phosphate dehydrogenase PdxA
VTAAGVITSNLPFTVVTAGHGGATNVANNASATVICTSTSITSAAAIAATATITFSATYFV